MDFLRNDTLHRFLTAPGQLRAEVLARPRQSWIVLDEVQRVPALLNEVHALMEEFGYRFALSGSSARPLERRGVNLLAGRASVKHLFPLTHAEIEGKASIEEVLRFGTLPLVLDNPQERVDVLEAYAGTCLREEIKEEAVTRRVDSFARFLEVAAIANAQVAHPKFYLFDTGVARALQGRLRDTPAPEELGHLLETYVCHELRAQVAYAECGGELCYWRTPQGEEVDFVWRRGKQIAAIEVKASSRWRVEYDAGLSALSDALPAARKFGVYLGRVPLRRPWGEVLPLPEFLERLAQGRISG